MGKPAAKKGDMVVAVDIHLVMAPTPGGPPAPLPLPHPFNGMLDGNLSPNVKIMGQPAATVGSTATNQPSHFPTPPGISFVIPPTNLATIRMGSTTVFINGKMAARMGDLTETCGSPSPNMAANLIATSTVMIGD